MRVTREDKSSLSNTMEDWCFTQYPTYSLLRTEVHIDDQESVDVKNAIFSQANPTPLSDPLLVCVSQDALDKILDMHVNIAEDPAFTAFVAGHRFPDGSRPVAHRYGGHQFGVWMGQLGDGRAHIMGEFINRRGERWQVQLKGSGRTPYSRGHDGQAVLRSSIREMVASEACHFLGIPTTRVAALVVSDARVSRDSAGDRRQYERTAATLRLSPCWFRIGSLEILTHTGEIAVLRQLCDFIIKEYYRDILLSEENRYIRLFSEIAERTLDLVAKWQAFGFTHGLLNTDNLSLLGLTLDYGPFGFMDCYDAGFVANSSDAGERYAFAKQPDVVEWSLAQFADSLRPLLNTLQQAHLTHIVGTLDTYCRNKILERFLMKLGLVHERWGDEQLVEKLLEMMQSTGADFTSTFRQLAELDPSELLSDSSLERAWSLKRLSAHYAWPMWVDSYRERLVKEAAEMRSSGGWEEERRRRMCRVNPAYVPRNWMLHDAIVDAEKNDFEKVKVLLQVFQNPYEIQPEAERRGFSSQPPQWARTHRINCSS